MNKEEREQSASEIRARLKEARKAKNYTHEQMGEFFGITKQGWRRYEESAELKASMIVQVCAILECSPSWLLGMKDEGMRLPPESELLKALKKEFERLNPKGQKKVLEYAEDLSESYGDKNSEKEVDTPRAERRSA